MEQLSSLTLILKPASQIDKSRPSRSLGPCLQGALMERVHADYAALLHQLPFNPYSQYAYWDGDSLIWKVNTLTNEAATQIIDPMRQMESVELRAIHTSFEVVKTLQESVSLKMLLNMVNEPGPSKVRVQFLTPAAFKSQGAYVIMPAVRLMVQNLLLHYGQVYDNNKEGFEETVEYVEKHVRILAYNLRSNYFGQAEGNKIPAFTGTMTLGLRGPDMTCGLMRMLLRFGEFSGVGIKTSMGMGGFKYLDK